MKKILIVDDEEQLVDMLSTILTNYDYEITTADNGVEALAKVMENPDYNVILTDVMMPEMNGVEFIKELRTVVERNIPVVILTADIKNKVLLQVINEGISGFVQKPFDVAELLRKLNFAVENPEEIIKKSAEHFQEEEFLKINIDEFIISPALDTDIYIKFSDGKFLKILSQGDALEIDRIKNYQSKNVKFLYVKKSDHQQYLDQTIEAFKKQSKNNLNSKVVAQELKKINELLVEEIYSEYMDERMFEASLEVSKQYCEVIFQNDVMYDLLKSLDEVSDDNYRHVMAVNVLSLMLAKKVGWLSESTLFKLSLASLYHDAGKKWISPSILLKPYENFNDNDWYEYRKHPQYGVEILSEVPGVPEDVLHIILQHHEKCSGDGFPNGLSYAKIHPLSRLISIINDYCSYVYNHNQYQSLNHVKAIQLMSEENKNYDGKLFSIFLSLFRED